MADYFLPRVKFSNETVTLESRNIYFPDVSLACEQLSAFESTQWHRSDSCLEIRGCFFTKSLTLEISFDKCFVDVPMVYNSKLIHYCHTNFVTQHVHQRSAIGMAMVLLCVNTEVRSTKTSSFCPNICLEL